MHYLYNLYLIYTLALHLFVSTFLCDYAIGAQEKQKTYYFRAMQPKAVFLILSRCH